MAIKIIPGNCLDVLAKLPANSVHMAVTSPPYWGLRTFDVPDTIWGGDPACRHSWTTLAARTLQNPQTLNKSENRESTIPIKTNSYTCSRCGAWKGQHGLEPSLAMFIAHEVMIFRAVRHVLRDDGSLWLNLGDSYATSVNGRSAKDTKEIGNDDRTFRDKPIITSGGRLKPKDLIGVPWRVALALQEDGWWLREDIIWHKPNSMPISATDRCTPAHEYLFHLTKQPHYYHDSEAIRETASTNYGFRQGCNTYLNQPAAGANHREPYANITRNKRTVWTIPTKSFSDDHFATFPTKLVEPCIKASTSEKGCCNKCGAPWQRITKTNGRLNKAWVNHKDDAVKGNKMLVSNYQNYSVETLGWKASCTCKNAKVVPATVLDPFGGSGTTGVVAEYLGRDSILIELGTKYTDMAKRRTTLEHFARDMHKFQDNTDDLGMFTEDQS